MGNDNDEFEMTIKNPEYNRTSEVKTIKKDINKLPNTKIISLIVDQSQEIIIWNKKENTLEITKRTDNIEPKTDEIIDLQHEQITSLESIEPKMDNSLKVINLRTTTSD
jgi:hypothetical protein